MLKARILTDEHIIDIIDSNRAGRDGLVKATQVSRAIEQAVLQSEQVQAWKRDAERYRWLMQGAYVGEWATPDGYEYRVDGVDRQVPDIDDVHTAIDAAMEQQA